MTDVTPESVEDEPPTPLPAADPDKDAEKAPGPGAKGLEGLRNLS